MTLTWCVDLKTYTQKSVPPCTWPAATSHVACGIGWNRILSGKMEPHMTGAKASKTKHQKHPSWYDPICHPHSNSTAGAPNEAVCGFQRAIQELQERGLTWKQYKTIFTSLHKFHNTPELSSPAYPDFFKATLPAPLGPTIATRESQSTPKSRFCASKKNIKAKEKATFFFETMCQWFYQWCAMWPFTPWPRRVFCQACSRNLPRSQRCLRHFIHTTGHENGTRSQ